MQADRDPMGRAIADYHRDGKAARLRVFSPMFDEDEIPVATLFRTLDEMPDIEREALLTAAGAILDVGAGAGCHALALQAMEKQVTAIDISPLAVATMRERGVKDVREQDFFTLDPHADERHRHRGHALAHGRLLHAGRPSAGTRRTVAVRL